MPSPVRLAAVCSLAGGLLAACGSGSTSSLTGVAAATGAGVPAACSLLSVADATGLAGAAVARRSDTTQSTTSSCVYADARGGHIASVVVTGTGDEATAERVMAAAIPRTASPAPAPVAGVGARALSFSGPGEAGIVFAKDGDYVLITVHRSDGVPAGTTATLVAVARKAAAAV